MKKLRKAEYNRHFGAYVEAYDNGIWYLLIINDRDGKSYFIVDKKHEYMYPINSIIKKFEIRDEDSFFRLDSVDLSVLGKSPCPKYVVDYFIKAKGHI